MDKFTGAFSGIVNGGTKTAGGTNLAGWIAQAMGITGVPASWASGLNTLIMRESGGNPNAINNWDSNAKNGDPSRGLMQTIGATFEQYRDKSLINDIMDPVANIVAGINYIKARYGDISNVQQADPSKPPKGYDQGGVLAQGFTSVFNGTGKPEAILNPQQWHTAARSIELATRIASTSTDLAPSPDNGVREEIAGLRQDLRKHGEFVADRNDQAFNRQISEARRRANAGTSKVTS